MTADLALNVRTPGALAGSERRPASLRADFSWMLVGNAVYASCQFATLMLLAKLLRPEMVGQYALGLAIVYPVMMFANLQLRAVITSDLREQTPFGFYLGLRLLTTSLGLAVVFTITQLLGYGRELTTVVLTVGLAYGIETISDVYYARLQLHDRMAEISKSMIARALLSILALSLATYIARSLLWGISSIAVARMAILLSYDFRRRTHGLCRPANLPSGDEELTPRFSLRIQRKLAWLSLPLGIVVLLNCLNASIPNFFIKHTLGDRDVGVFAALGFMVSVGNMAVVSLGQSAFTRLAASYANGDLAVFSSLVGKLLVFGAAIGAVGIAISKMAGREILTILFHPQYAQRADLLPWMMAAGVVLFMAQFLGFAMTAANFYSSQVAVNILANLGLFAGCYWLVARQGLLGAIYAMMIAATLQLVGSISILVRGMRAQSRLCVGRIETA
ncbi:MAG TPA: oligosaccharide flippase family protein [Candidatus Acidoferrales bacterium]|nr:oligosaccharide flippase family protein [Candidatus Acidoferrales bacterium]